MALDGFSDTHSGHLIENSILEARRVLSLHEAAYLDVIAGGAIPARAVVEFENGMSLMVDKRHKSHSNSVMNAPLREMLVILPLVVSPMCVTMQGMLTS